MAELQTFTVEKHGGESGLVRFLHEIAPAYAQSVLLLPGPKLLKFKSGIEIFVGRGVATARQEFLDERASKAAGAPPDIGGSALIEQQPLSRRLVAEDFSPLEERAAVALEMKYQCNRQFAEVACPEDAFALLGTEPDTLEKIR